MLSATSLANISLTLIFVSQMILSKCTHNKMHSALLSNNEIQQRKTSSCRNLKFYEWNVLKLIKLLDRMKNQISMRVMMKTNAKGYTRIIPTECVEQCMAHFILMPFFREYEWKRNFMSCQNEDKKKPCQILEKLLAINSLDRN